MRNRSLLIVAGIFLLLSIALIPGVLSPSFHLGRSLAFMMILLAGGLFLGVYLYSIISSFSDANRRGKPGWLVALFVAFFSWPVGWIAWIIFRPNDRIRN